ncbi:MAG: dUTP diphosphatase [Myxococcota bacterium]
MLLQPKRASDQAAGYDLVAANSQPISLRPGERVLVPTGIALALPPGVEAQVRPRSGLALKHGVTCLNAPGTIDADYRGEVGVILVNHGQETFTVKRGMRVAQLVIAAVVSAAWRLRENLPASSRGAGGFGSTGVATKPCATTSA